MKPIIRRAFILGITCLLLATLVGGSLGVFGASDKIDESSKLPFVEEAVPATSPDRIEKTTGSPAEIERKFFILPENLPKEMETAGKKYGIVQTYINYSPELRVRQLNNNGYLYYYFNLKRPLDSTGLSREEIQFQITKEEYLALLPKQSGRTIYKDRYQFLDQGVFVFVDVYSGSLAGLVVAEVEFESVEEAAAFVPLDWFGKDITSDSRYKNANLAKNGVPSPQ